MNSRRHLVPAVVTALAVAAPAALAALPHNATYTGATNEFGAVTLKLNGDGTRIKRLRINYRVTCNNGQSTNTYTDIRGARIRKNGFAATGSYTGSQDGSKNKFSVSGKVWKNTAHGRFSLTATAKANGGKKLKCQSDKLTWSAKRQK